MININYDILISGLIMLIAGWCSLSVIALMAPEYAKASVRLIRNWGCVVIVLLTLLGMLFVGWRIETKTPEAGTLPAPKVLTVPEEDVEPPVPNTDGLDIQKEHKERLDDFRKDFLDKEEKNEKLECEKR